MTALRANLFFVALGLSLLGIVMVYSATSKEYGTHYLVMRSFHVALGIGAFWMMTRVRYTAWRKYAPFFYLAVLLALVLVLIPGLGTEVGGARRWFDLGVFSLQPAEFAKLAAVLVLSSALSKPAPGTRIPLPPLLAVGLLAGLVLIEPDFGTSIVVLAGIAGVMWASELRTKDLLIIGGGALIVLIGVMFLEPYRRERFMTFLNPWAVADGSGYQIVQSMLAIGVGSIFGTGPGAGGQGAFIPEAHTDMIFALIGEELGLVGMVLVIAAFSFLSLAGLRVAIAAPTVMGRCIAAGITSMFAVQTTFNIGAVMGVVPLAGMTLPFISYGGSSAIVSFAAVGILYRISEDSERAREVRARRRLQGDDRGRRYRGARDPRAVRSR